MCKLFSVSNFSLLDLFDDEGFSLSDINETVVGTKPQIQSGDIYFLESDEYCHLDEVTDDSGHHSLSLSLDGEIDLQRVKVCTYVSST